MKRRLLGLAALAAVMGLTTASAHGFGKRKADCGSVGYGYGGGGYADCGYGGYGGYGAGNVTYVEQKVMVTEWVPTKEEYKYVEMQPEKKKEKVKVKEMVWKDKEYKYNVTEYKAAKEKVKVNELKPQQREVEVTLYDMQPVVVNQKRVVCDYVCVPVTVTCMVPPPAPRGGCCAPCGAAYGAAYGAPCGPQYVTRTVMQRQAVTREVEVPVTTYNRVERKEKRQVTEYQWVAVEKEVEVQRPVQVEKVGMQKVAEWVETEKEVEVTSWKQVEKVGTHNVYKPVQVEKVVKVPVYTPAPAPAMSYYPCAPYGGYGAYGMGGCCGGASRGGCCR